MVEVDVQALVVDTSSPGGSPIVLLGEKEGFRILPIWIGHYEALSISYAYEDEKAPRPITLDMIERIIRALGARVIRIIVDKLEDSTFYAKIIMEQRDTIVVIDARPSDSIALALRTKAPIYVADEIMEDKNATFDGRTRLSERIIEELKEEKPENLGSIRWKK